MSILKAIDPAITTGKTKQLFDALQQKLGMVPNLAKVLANSPAALNAYLSFSGALNEGKLSARTREQIAVAVAASTPATTAFLPITPWGNLQDWTAAI